MEIPASSVTYALIVANVVASLYALVFDEEFTEQFAFDVGAVSRRKQTYRIFTSSFLHVNLFHLLFNMVALFSFGPYVEITLGKAGFLVVYFGAILASGIFSFYINRRNLTYTSVGASDAVSGVVFAFILFQPLSTLYMFPIPFPIPALLFGVIFLVVSSTLISRDNRRIAHEGHLGGAVAGMVLTILMVPAVVPHFFRAIGSVLS